MGKVPDDQERRGAEGGTRSDRDRRELRGGSGGRVHAWTVSREALTPLDDGSYGDAMSDGTDMRVNASITISLDGYVVGPNDGPGKGLGEGGERLHYWVFGGPWSYAEEPTGEATGVDKQYLDEAFARNGAVVVGRNMYESAEAWGGSNPFGVPMFVVTHRTEGAPAGFTFVNGFDDAISQAIEAAGDREVAVGGGADVIRQALVAGYVEELGISIAPVVLGGGKRLFEGFDRSIDLEHLGVLQSPWATHITYRVKR